MEHARVSIGHSGTVRCVALAVASVGERCGVQWAVSAIETLHSSAIKGKTTVLNTKY